MTQAATVIDVGGTYMRWGRWTPEGGLKGRQHRHTPCLRRHANLSVPQLQALLIDEICQIPPCEDDAVVGLSFGAAMNHRNGTVYASAPLWGSYEIPFDLLGALSGKRPDVEWHIVNDVTAALMHVTALPLCAQDRKVMLLTISTGIAARVIDRWTQRIPVDASGLQGEIGHLPVTASICGEPVSLNCDCGEPGHLSAYSSGPGIAQMAEFLRKRQPLKWSDSVLGRRIAEGVPFEDAFKSAVSGQDSIAITLLDAVTAPVADLVRTTLCLFPDVDRIILTGGVAVSLGQHYKAAIMLHLSRQGIYLTSKYHPQWMEDRIVICEADCLIGAGIAAIAVLGRPTLRPTEHELLVAPLYVGLCGTDIQMLRGLRADPSPIIGHEGVARVVATGSRVPERLAAGTLVCINPTHRHDPSFLLGHNVDGLLQERVLIKGSAVRDGLVLPLNEIHNTVISTLMEPLAVVHYALSLFAEHRPHTLVVFGDGTIGHLAVRSAAEKLGAAIRVVHIHHTEQGIRWSQKHKISSVRGVLNDATAVELLSSLPKDERVAVLLATPRDATLLCLENALCHLRGDLIIDLLGGLPANISSSLLPGVDLSAIRAANCAGSPHPAKFFTVPTRAGKTVCLFGHRGVAHRHLRSAAAELAKNPMRYRELITHVVDLDEAAVIMRQLATSRERVVGNRRLIKLAVRMTPAHNRTGSV